MHHTLSWKIEGLNLAIVFIPEKCHVYSEPIAHLLPDFDGKSSTFPLIEYISNNTDATVVSLFEVLNSQKKAEQLYYKNDTHWSSIGAYLGYQEIISSLVPDISPLEMVAWKFDTDFTTKERIGDLGSFTNLPEFITETVYLPNNSSEYYLSQTRLESGELVYENPQAENDLTLIVFCDFSFGVPPITKFLATHYREAVFFKYNQWI